MLALMIIVSTLMILDVYFIFFTWTTPKLKKYFRWVEFHRQQANVISIIAKFVFPFFLLFLVYFHTNISFVKSDTYTFQMFVDDLKTTFSALRLSIDTEFFQEKSYRFLFYIDWFCVIAIFYASVINMITISVINNIKLFFIIRKNYDIIFGYEHAYEYYKTHRDRVICFVGLDTDRETLKKLSERQIPYIKSDLTYEAFINNFQFKKRLKKTLKGKKCSTKHLIVFEDYEDREKLLAKFYMALTKEVKIKGVTHTYAEMSGLVLHYEIDDKDITSIQDKFIGPDKNTSTHITKHIDFFSSHDLIAKRFVFENPITKNMPEGFIDYNTATVDENKNINVILVGYGKVNRSILRKYIANTHIPALHIEDGKYSLKNHMINYHIFEKRLKRQTDNTNLYFTNTINRFINDESLNKDDYYPYPDVDFNVKEYSGDVSRVLTPEVVLNIVHPGDNNYYTDIVVSIGDDIDNIDYALKLSMLLKEANLDIKNYHIYVRVQELKEDISEIFSDDFTYFGLNKIILSHDSIVNDRLLDICHILNKEYTNNGGESEISESWYTTNLIKRESNIYSSLNLRLKLNLVGYDILDAGKTSDEVYNDLAKVFVKKGSNYDDYLFFNKNDIAPTAMEVLSYQEHSRWNAFYMAKGYVPQKKNTLKFVNGSIYKSDDILRTHMCLTTYEGLDQYHRDVANMVLSDEAFENYFKNKLKYIGNDLNDLAIKALDNFQTYIYDYDLMNSISDIKNHYIIERRNKSE